LTQQGEKKKFKGLDNDLGLRGKLGSACYRKEKAIVRVERGKFR